MDKIIQVLKPHFRIDEILAEIRECLEKGWTGIGYKTEVFERQWALYSGHTNSHYLNSATSGLHLAMNILKFHHGWEDGDEVITTPLTFVSTNHAIMYERLSPVFADISESSLCLDPESVRQAITERTRAVIYVGIGGNAEGYAEIQKICDEKGLALILDGAHMAGTRWSGSGHHIGLDADCAVYSFQAVKNCPSGDSGMICFKSDTLDQKARQMSWLGIDKSTFNRYSESSYKWRYSVDDVGFKYHGNSIMASLCLVSLKYLDDDNAKRRELARLYDKYLSNVPGINCINHSPSIISSRHLYQIVTNDRDSLIEKLALSGIYCGVHYIDNQNYKPYLQCKSYAQKSKILSEKLVSLPLHLELEDADVRRVCEAIIK